jgi:hypothetical protein
MTKIHARVLFPSGHRLTRHAWERMTGRGFSPRMIRMVLDHGRAVHLRGAIVQVVGRREVARHRRDGVGLEQVEGLQVVCTPRRDILTVYRNHNLRGLRPRRQRARFVRRR